MKQTSITTEQNVKAASKRHPVGPSTPWLDLPLCFPVSTLDPSQSRSLKLWITESSRWRMGVQTL